MIEACVVQIRSTLEGRLVELQEEVVTVKHDLEKSVAAQKRAEKEAEESRRLWEAEVGVVGGCGDAVIHFLNIQVSGKSRLAQRNLELEKLLPGAKAEAENLVSAVSIIVIRGMPLVIMRVYNILIGEASNSQSPGAEEGCRGED